MRHQRCRWLRRTKLAAAPLSGPRGKSRGLFSIASGSLAAPLTRQGQMKPRGCRRTRSANCRATSTTTAPQYRWRLWLTFFKGLQASSRTEIVFVWNANEGSATVWSSTSSVASCCPTTRSRMYQQQKSRNLFSERLTIHGWRRSPSSPLMRPSRGANADLTNLDAAQ